MRWQWSTSLVAEIVLDFGPSMLKDRADLDFTGQTLAALVFCKLKTGGTQATHVVEGEIPKPIGVEGRTFVNRSIMVDGELPLNKGTYAVDLIFEVGDHP